MFYWDRFVKNDVRFVGTQYLTNTMWLRVNRVSNNSHNRLHTCSFR